MPNNVKIGYNHPLCLMLQKKGYSVRLSQDIITLVFGAIKDALLDKETVDLPIGTFSVELETRKKQRRIGLNGPEWLFKRKYLVKFRPKMNIVLDLRRSNEEIR